MAIQVGSAYGVINISIDNVLKSIAAAQGALGTFMTHFNKVGQNIKRVGDDMTRNLTLPLVAVGLASGKTAMDFQTSMQHIVGLVGESQDQVNAWAEDLKRLGPELGKSPKELADALYFVTSAGIKGGAALDIVTMSAKAAAAGLGETQVVTDAVSSVLNAYGAANITAADATDILVATVREGKAEADAVAPALGRVIPIAAQMGISFRDVGAAMAEMTRLGFSAEESATNLSGIMSAFLKPSKQAADIMAEVGLSAEGMRQAIQDEGLLGALTLLKEKIGGNDEAMAAIFPNIRGLRGMLSLVGENAAQTEKVFASMAVTTGLTDKAFGAIADTAGFKLKQAMSEVQVVLITLGDAVLPVIVPILKELADTLKGVAEWFKALSPEVQHTIVTALALTAALGPLLSITGRFMMVLSAIVPVLLNVVAAGAKFIKFGFEVVQYLVEGTAITGALLIEFAALAAALVIIAKFFEQVSVAARATNEDLLKMSHSGDFFEQAAASFEILTNGVSRLSAELVAHEAEVRKTAGSYEDYATEMQRAVGLTDMTIDANGNLVRTYWTALGMQTKVIQANFLMSDAMYKAGDQAQREADYLDNVARDSNEAGQGLNAAADATDALTEAQLAQAAAQKSQIALLAAAYSSAVEYYGIETDLKDKQQELADLDAEIAKNGPQRVAMLNNEKMSIEEQAAASAKMLKINEDIVSGQRKKKETDLEYASRLADLKAKYADLDAQLGTHTGVLGGATEKQKEQRDAILASIDALKASTLHDLGAGAFEALNEAFANGAMPQEMYLQRAKFINDQYNLFDEKSLAAATAVAILNKDIGDPATANYATDLVTANTNLQILLGTLKEPPPAPTVMNQAGDSILERVKGLKEKLTTSVAEAKTAIGVAGDSMLERIQSLHGTVAKNVQAATTTALMAVGNFKTAIQTIPRDVTINFHLKTFGDIPTGTPIAGHKAIGGPVMPWQAYVVGERGPEIFVPSQAGTIVPNGGSAKAGSGLPAMGGDTFITNIYDRTSANLIGALIEERKRKRLNEWMGG